ncbi:unnamed protein product [Closterium sp. NIES-54]
MTFNARECTLMLLACFVRPPSPVIPLITGRILLHWKVLAGPVFQMAFEAKRLSGAENSWISVGWSNNGAMAPADAVVGNTPGIKAYRLDGYKMAELVNDTFSLGPNPSVTTSSTGSTFLKFSRSNGDGGTVPINLSGETYVIWAFSRGMLDAFGYHDYNSCTDRAGDLSFFLSGVSPWLISSATKTPPS